MRTRNLSRLRPAARVAGFSLIELMVAMVAGLIVSAALVAFTMSSFKSNGEYVLSTRLTQELRNSLDLVTRDLRRAGYDQNALDIIASGTMSNFAKMHVEGALTPSSCVIYAYDRLDEDDPNGDGNVGVNNGEVRGLRRIETTYEGATVGVIEYAVSGNDEKPACDGATADYTSFPPACDDDSRWCPLSDPAILNITAFTLTDERETVGAAPTQVVLRDLGIEITGQLANSTEFSRSVKSSVRVRSDCFSEDLTDCNDIP